MTKVVECEVCESKMAKLSKHMQEKWMGNVCKECRKKIKRAEFIDFVKRKIGATTSKEVSEELKNVISTMRPTVSMSDHEKGQHPKERVREIISTAPEPFNLMFELGYAYARRLGEVRRLRSNYVDREEDAVTFPVLKKKEVRKIDFSLDLLPKKWRDKLIEKAKESEGVSFEVEEDNAVRQGEVIKNSLFPYTQRQIQYAFEKTDSENTSWPFCKDISPPLSVFFGPRVSENPHPIRREG